MNEYIVIHTSNKEETILIGSIKTTQGIDKVRETIREQIRKGNYHHRGPGRIGVMKRDKGKEILV